MILKQLAKALIRLRVCTGWSEPLLVVHTVVFEISCRGSIIDTCVSFYYRNTIHLPPNPKTSFRPLKRDIQDFHMK